MVPRSVTSSVAVDMARCLGAPTECAGLAVLLQAAVAVAVGKLLLSIAYGSRLEPAAEGVAAGTTAGALGVAGIAGGTPAALAAGGLAYAVMAAVSGALVRVPQVAAALSKVVGA
jgi:putative effector of murein hydrolase